MDESTWEGFRRLDFKFQGRDAVLICPDQMEEKGRWAIYSEYFWAFPNTAIALLRCGYHLAYLRNQSRWGTDVDQTAKCDFSDYLETKFNLAHRCVPIGMSCGGLHAVNFASRHPDRVSVLYLDAPLLNMLSYPMGYGMVKRDETVVRECLDAIGMTESQLICYREHPIDRLDTLTNHGIPVFMVYGDSDPIVPYAENGAILEAHYRHRNAKIQVIGKPGCAHHPHGLENPEPIVDFIRKHD